MFAYEYGHQEKKLIDVFKSLFYEYCLKLCLYMIVLETKHTMLKMGIGDFVYVYFELKMKDIDI